MSDLVGSTAEAALRAGEEQWRSAFEASGFGAWLADHNHRFLSTNATFQAMLGYTREELRRLSPLDVAAEDEREACRALLLELQQGARRSFEATIKCERRDRSLIVVSHHVSAIQGSDGSPPRFIATTVDITARKQAEHALRTTRSELGRAAQLTAMGVMTASIAHDINQPLAVVTTAGNAAMRWLDRTPFDVQSARASLRRVIGNGHRAGVMIDNARAVFKRDEKEKTPLDVNSVIREVLGLVRGELQDHGVSAESELAEGLPQVSANRLQLQVLMLNLLENAADAMGSASRRPRVLRVTSAPDGADHVVVTFHDSGPGIAPSDVNRIFAAFFTTKPHRVGMGLSICRSIVDAHKGRLWAAAGVANGAIFHLALPAHRPAVG